MELKDAISRALKIRSHYAAFETRLYGRSWTGEELFIIAGMQQLALEQRRLRAPW